MTQLPAVSRYSIAVTCAIGAVLVRLALEPLLGVDLRYILFLPAVTLSAWLGGVGPGGVTTTILAAAALYFWVEPSQSWRVTSPTDWLGFGVFLSIGFVISALNEAWRKGAVALAESERRLKLTLQSIGDAVITIDTHGHITQLNPVAEQLTGWLSADAIGKPFDEVFVVVNERTKQREENPVSRVLREGTMTAPANSALLLSRDGREIPIDDSAAPIRSNNGQTTGIILVFRDIAERRRYESEREAQVRASRELAAIVESSDDAIVSKDLESTIKSWNRGAEHMFGYTAEEAVGEPIKIIIPEDRWSEEDEALRRLRRGEKVDHFETIRQRKDGTELAVSLTISPLYSTSGVVIGASKIVRDISQRVQLERETARVLAQEQSARAALERASRLKDDFLAALSHELRTPLNAIVGYARLLVEGNVPADRIQHALHAIQRSAHAQSRLLESLLDLSRIMAGKLELSHEALDLCGVVDAAVDAFRPEAEVKKVALHVVPQCRPILLWGDESRLQQVFLNLFSNATKFTQPGGEVRAFLTINPGSVQVQITDDGQGIKPDFLPHVFDRFAQEDRQQYRGSTGLGLGLSLVRELVQAHGGTVTAESRGEGLGSTFTVTLPLVERSSDRNDQDRLVGKVTTLPEQRILVVDDEPDARDLLALMLTTRGAIVRTASSAAQALEILLEERPDLLLADIKMPDEDGYSLIRRVRALEVEHQIEHLPAIALTAYASQNDQDQISGAGYDGHLAKPIDADLLIQAIVELTGVETP